MTLVARPTPPTVPRPDLEVLVLGASCVCQDKDLDRLRDLMTRHGMSQWDASRLLWSPTVPPGQAVAVETPGAWATRFVRAVLTARLPWLRLPTPSEVSR